MSLLNIGSIHIDTGLLFLADPCVDYNLDSLFSVVPGKYDCYVEYASVYRNNDYLKAIYCINNGYPFSKNQTGLKWNHSHKYVGVDSGQAGFFKNTIYHEHAYIESDQFYDECTSMTMNSDYGLVADNRGFVASSGVGDGSYPIEYLEDTKYNKGIYGLRMIFIPDTDESNYEDKDSKLDKEKYVFGLSHLFE